MIKLEFGDIITHEKMLDCAVMVQKIFDTGDKIKIKGLWVNQGCVKTFPLGIKAKFYINKKDLKHWKKAKNPQVQCVRQGEWIYLT